MKRKSKELTPEQRLAKGREEFLEKVKSGEAKRANPKNPYEKLKEKPNSLRFSINAFCYECNGESRSAVRDCLSPECPLFNVRPWQKSDDDDD